MSVLSYCHFCFFLWKTSNFFYRRKWNFECIRYSELIHAYTSMRKICRQIKNNFWKIGHFVLAKYKMLSQQKARFNKIYVVYELYTVVYSTMPFYGLLSNDPAHVRQLISSPEPGLNLFFFCTTTPLTKRLNRNNPAKPLLLNST